MSLLTAGSLWTHQEVGSLLAPDILRIQASLLSNKAMAHSPWS